MDLGQEPRIQSFETCKELAQKCQIHKEAMCGCTNVDLNKVDKTDTECGRRLHTITYARLAVPFVPFPAPHARADDWGASASMSFSASPVPMVPFPEPDADGVVSVRPHPRT